MIDAEVDKVIIDKVIKVIERKIRSLENIKKVLIDEFVGVGESEKLSLFPMEKSVQSETRKQRIIRLLQEEGSLSSKAILEKTGIPRGTINFVLNDKDIFYSNGGVWNLVAKKTDKGLTGLE